VSATEAAIRDRAADSLAEVEHLEVRRMFSGFGFYVDGLLVAAAWDGAFRLRHHERGSWVYKAVDDSTIDEPAELVGLFRDRALVLSRDPAARSASKRRRYRHEPCQRH
jgi:Regulator of competence-specific genes